MIRKQSESWLQKVGNKAAVKILQWTGGKSGQKGGNKELKPKKSHYADLNDGTDFMNAVIKVERHGKTLMSLSRLHVLWQGVRNTQHIPGDIAEVGVYRGGSSYFLADSALSLGSPPHALHAIDTFTGHAAGTISEADSFHSAGMFADTDYEAVRKYLADFDFVQVHKGEFSDVAHNLESSKYRLVHIDTDLYQPTIDCFNFFVPRLSAGGVIIVDDYLGRKCPGVTSAVHEFLASRKDFNAWFFQTEQLLLQYIPLTKGNRQEGAGPDGEA